MKKTHVAAFIIVLLPLSACDRNHGAPNSKMQAAGNSTADAVTQAQVLARLGDFVAMGDPFEYSYIDMNESPVSRPIPGTRHGDSKQRVPGPPRLCQLVIPAGSEHQTGLEILLSSAAVRDFDQSIHTTLPGLRGTGLPWPLRGVSILEQKQPEGTLRICAYNRGYIWVKLPNGQVIRGKLDFDLFAALMLLRPNIDSALSAEICEPWKNADRSRSIDRYGVIHDH